MAKVLLVDDDLQLRSSLSRLLTSAGHCVIEANHGKEALSIVRRDRPQVMVTDIIMPEKEGIETIIEARAVAPAMGIIAMSGGGNAGVVDFLPIARKLGAHRTLAKPIRAADLLMAVGSLSALAEQET